MQSVKCSVDMDVYWRRRHDPAALFQDATLDPWLHLLKVDGLYGCDSKFYVNGEPLYDGTTYFVGGTISGTILTPDGKTDSIDISISEDRVWTVLCNGESI